MMVTFVSQCEKNALKKTRRVLDAFANRIGDNTWQTLITEDGLQTVHKMLKQTASRSTAVSCHWIRSRSRSQFLWVVGNKNKFNLEGIVPVNRTEQEFVTKEQFSLNMEVIAYLAAIAGFFHDIGKANQLFQEKLGVLKSESGQLDNRSSDDFTKKMEPLRHEWISLRLFQAFVGQQTDQQWLKALAEINCQSEEYLIKELDVYKDLLVKDIPSPLISLPPIASVVGWLIVSHHRLPQYSSRLDNSPDLNSIHLWKQAFDSSWNSPQAFLEHWSLQKKEQNWHFPFGTPYRSAFWQTHIANFAQRALKCQRLLSLQWQNNLFTQHLARLSLMLADHCESSRMEVDNECSDRNYPAYANTDRNDEGHRYLKQKLDEHNIKVGKLAYSIACDLPGLKQRLETLGKVKALETKVPREYKSEFGWQDKAAQLAASIRETTKKYGFFGISMASTGKGKTRANAKIMYALSGDQGCRFNVALGLRTLSIQTADALRKDLFDADSKSQQLAEQHIALLVGSQAVRDLHQFDLIEEEKHQEEIKGSQSKESLLSDELILHDSFKNPELLEQIAWLAHDPKILRLLYAPVLVSTIDYLIPATDGVRGGRQIAPMLRLLTSDLVLDEPDDFSLDDIHALCRIVNWAGMLGSRVLLSTATISPSLARVLFEAYQTGRKQYTQANGEQDVGENICCAWFDECNQPQHALVSSVNQFKQQHETYVNTRVKELLKVTQPLRKGRLVHFDIVQYKTPSSAFTARIFSSIQELHSQHAIAIAEKQISIGLVRMANIGPLVRIAEQLFAKSAPENMRIHWCVYHSQYPLIQRTSIEQMLDKALKRDDLNKWKTQSGIVDIINAYSETHHLFVVLATSVAEVGRDHDYDWAIVEPSSLRSIIQLAGRVQRHRKMEPKYPNIHVLSKNYKGLKGLKPSFLNPGFESKKLMYVSDSLGELKIEQDLKEITAVPRVLEPGPNSLDLAEDKSGKFCTFSQLEHAAQLIALKGCGIEQNYTALWWLNDVSWCGEIQRHQPFRYSIGNDDYCVTINQSNHLRWQKKQQAAYPVQYQNTEDIKTLTKPLEVGDRVQFWHQFNLPRQIERLAAKTGKNEQQIMQVYTHVSLDKLNKDTVVRWYYRPELGIYKILDKDE